MFGIDSIVLNTEVTIKGWVANIRKAGSLLFLIMRDRDITLQTLALKKELGDDVFNSLKKHQ
jgi:aspartyl-tRNA synthetase